MTLLKWKRRLSSPDAKLAAEARLWLPEVLRRLENNTMPPNPGDREAFAGEKASLVEFLRLQVAKNPLPK